MMNRERLTEMLTPTAAKLRNLRLDDAYHRVSEALRNPRFLADLQTSIWEGLEAERPDEPEATRLDRVEKRGQRPRRYKAATVRPSDEGAWTAFSIWLDQSANIASGEAVDLLATDDGQRILRRGLALIGRHLANELLR
ncbi:MAG: hypothetical protein IPK13_01700 [Deltaproteobacteria bacterium]|nr:hypothetical protein [Deltaproteobacteria bacterium]